MQNRSSGIALTAMAVGLMSASIVGLTKLPAASSAHPDRSFACRNADACLHYINNGAGDAIDGTASVNGHGNGVYGISNSAFSTGVIGRNFSGGWGLVGQTSGPPGFAAGVGAYSSNSNPALTASVSTASTFAPVIQGFNAGGKIAELDDAGNWGIAGLLYSSGQCENGCSRTRHIRTYAPREALPTSEDAGEARLIAGRASVHLDHAFANVIDRKSSYVVLITPEGDNHGLYVTQRSISGFEVRESQGGRSTIDFAYRIIAHPYGVTAARLPVVDDKAPSPRFAPR